MVYKYVIPEIPPSNNKYIGQNKRWQYQTAKKQWADIIYYACRHRPEKPIEKATVTLTYYFNNRIRHDPDNYSGKFLLDGLVKAGVIKDDNFDCITLVLRAGYDKSYKRTEITIEEILP